MVTVSTIAVILAGSLLVPAIDDATDGEPITYRNDSGVYVDKSASTGELTITKAANSTTVQVNTETREPDSTARTLLALPGCSVALANSTQTYVVLINDTVNNKYIMVSEENELSLSITNETCSYSVDTTEVSLTVGGDFFYYAPNGAYAMCTPTSGVYVKLADYVAYSQVSRHTYWYTSEGIYDNTTIDDTLTATITSEKMPGSEDKMDYVTGVTINGNTAYVSFAPRETTIHINEMDGGTGAIMYAIPVMVFAAIIISAVAIITRNRD